MAILGIKKSDYWKVVLGALIVLVFMGTGLFSELWGRFVQFRVVR